jgi:2'-5' RNA ligase
MKSVPAYYLKQRSLGYLIVAFPSEHFRAQIGQLQQKLTGRFPGVIWPMPRDNLHFTLCEIIQPKVYSEDKELLYQKNKMQYEAVPAKVMAKTPKLTVLFDEIEVSPHAIIVRASDSVSFNTIRDKLVDDMDLPSETRTPPDITHSTIARYLKEIELEEVQNFISSQTISIKEEITEFKLLKTEGVSLKNYQVIKTSPLAQI